MRGPFSFLITLKHLLLCSSVETQDDDFFLFFTYQD